MYIYVYTYRNIYSNIHAFDDEVRPETRRRNAPLSGASD